MIKENLKTSKKSLLSMSGMFFCFCSGKKGYFQERSAEAPISALLRNYFTPKPKQFLSPFFLWKKNIQIESKTKFGNSSICFQLFFFFLWGRNESSWKSLFFSRLFVWTSENQVWLTFFFLFGVSLWAKDIWIWTHLFQKRLLEKLFTFGD